jgi:arylsulfatase A-like enzyme
MPKYKNILVLMCDHHRFDALSCLGNPLAHTPNLDRLAARSVRFASCYNQAPVCAPTRHSLATGRYCHAHGVITNRHRPFPGMVTIAHALQPLGYRRFQLGQMHWTDPALDTGYEPWIDQEMWRQSMPREVLDRCDWESEGITRRTTGGPSTRSREQYWGYHVGCNAVRLIESAVERDEPFLCWAAFAEPHPPFYPPRELYQRIDHSQIALPPQAPVDAPPPHPEIDRKRLEWAHLTEVEIRQIIAGYYGMVALVDGYCGMVLDALDRLGIREETIVVWTVDHGDQMWEHQLFLKFVMREASVHVPLLIDVPGVVSGVRPEFSEHVDLFSTLCDLVGAPIPDTVQGRSLAPLLGTAPAPASWRDAVYSQIGDVQMVRTAKHKLNLYDGEPGELFDLEEDPHEFYNRISEREQADVIASLCARLASWQAATDPGPR